MRTLGEAVQELIAETPFLEDTLSNGTLNLSAYARLIKPNIAKKLYTEPSDAAIVMALVRASRNLGKKHTINRGLRGLHSLSVRSGLVEFAFHTSTSLFELQKELFSKSEEDKDLFVSFTQGVSEVTLIVSNDLAGIVTKLVAKEGIIDTIRDLAAITLKLKKEHIYTPGVHYALHKQLAWENINVIETISSYSEITLIFETKNLARAFACLQGATGKA